MEDDDEIVPTSDPEEAYEMSIRLTMPSSTTVFSNNLAVRVPARKRARQQEWIVAATPSPAASRESTPSSSPSPARRAPSRNASPGPSRVRDNTVHIKEEDSYSQDPLDLILLTRTPVRNTYQPSSPPSLDAPFPPPSMTPISTRDTPFNSSQEPALPDDNLPQDNWKQLQSSTPALTPDKDDLMDFGDSEPERPATPPPPFSRTRTSPLIGLGSSLSSAPASPQQRLPAPEPEQDGQMDEDSPDIPPETRYSLRHRTAKQKNPYRYDDLTYKHQLKDNPDAIVKMRHLERQRQLADDQYEQNAQEEYRAREERLPGPSRHGGTQQPADLPVGLEPIPDFDEEDREIRKEMKVANKEVATAKRRRQQEEKKARERDAEQDCARASDSKQQSQKPPSVADSFRALSISPRKHTPHSRHRSSSRRVVSPSPSPLRPPSPLANGDTMMDIDVDAPMPYESPPRDPYSTSPERNAARVEEEEDEDESSSSEEEVDPRLNILKKMYPAFMLSTMSKAEKARAVAKKKKKKQQLKKRRNVSSPRPPSKIVGDPESSDEGAQAQTIDPHDDLFAFGEVGPGHSSAKGSRVTTEIIDISSDDEVFEDEVGDEENSKAEDVSVPTHYISDIDASSSDREEKPTWTLFGKEPDLIDFMLARPVRTNGIGKQPSMRRGPGKRRSKGKGKSREIQTKLTDWGGHGRSIRTHGRRGSRPGPFLLEDSDEEETYNRDTASRSHRPSKASRKNVDANDGDDEGETRYSHLTDKERARKELLKRRQEQKAKNGVYIVMAPRGTHLLAGQRHTHSADLELELAVSEPNSSESTTFTYGPRRPKPTARPAFPEARMQPSPDDPVDGPSESSPDVIDVTKFTFKPTTYIGKGWLFELLHSSAPDASAIEPIPLTVSGITFSPTMSAEAFLGALRDLWTTSFEALTGLPDVSFDILSQNIGPLCRSACTTLSHLLSSSSPQTRSALSDGVKSQIRELLHQKLLTPAFEHATDDQTLRTFLWLPIELGVRTGILLPSAGRSDDLLFSAAEILVARLIKLGVRAALESVESDSVNHALHPVELWVCLFHVLRPASTDGAHVIWNMVEMAFKAQGCGDLSPMEMSERLWDNIHMLSDLFMFSVHGRYTTGSVSYPAWNMVLLALDSVSLGELDKKGKLSRRALVFRDRYIASIIRRCSRLPDRCKWSLEGAYQVLMRLGNAFKNRKFASLAHEGGNYPRFIRRNDWDHFLVFEAGDTAYTTFLKMVMQSMSVLPPVQRKKVLANSFATVKFSFSKSNPPAADDLSSLTNRFSGTIVAIKAMPAIYEQRVKQAQGYVDFHSADDNTRWIAIQGFEFISRTLIHLELPLDSLMEWLEEIIVALLADCKAREATDEHPLYNVKMLVRSMGYIFGAYYESNIRGGKPRYPNTTILALMQRITRNTSLRDDEDLRADCARMYDAFFRARLCAVPKPVKPAVALVSNEESQDSAFADFQDDFDYNDPTVWGEEAPPVADNWEVEDKTLAQILIKDFWYILRFCSSPHVDPKVRRDRDRWLRTLANSLVLCGDGTLASRWKSFVDNLKQLPETAQRQTQLRVLYHLLRADPSAYGMPVFGPLAKEVVFISLVPREVTVEHAELLSEVLDLDQRQPKRLFPTVPFEQKDDLSYELIVSELEENTPNLIDGVLQRVDEHLTEHNEADAAESFSLLTALFSCMRSVHRELGDGTDIEALDRYVRSCRKIIEKTRQYATLCAHSRMKFWTEWFSSV